MTKDRHRRTNSRSTSNSNEVFIGSFVFIICAVLLHVSPYRWHCAWFEFYCDSACM